MSAVCEAESYQAIQAIATRKYRNQKSCALTRDLSRTHRALRFAVYPSALVDDSDGTDNPESNIAKVSAMEIRQDVLDCMSTLCTHSCPRPVVPCGQCPSVGSPLSIEKIAFSRKSPET